MLTLDPASDRLYVFAESGVATVIDTSTRPAASVAKGLLASNAHSGTVDPVARRLYVPVADVGGRPVLRVLDEGP